MSGFDQLKLQRSATKIIAAKDRRIQSLEEALRTSLKQWEDYADMSRAIDSVTYIASGHDKEAKLYRKLRARLRETT